MSANTQLSKEEQMIAFFVERLQEKGVGRTQIQKYVYLADYEARRFFGKPISKVPYVWHHYGPYDKELPEKLDRLKKGDVIREMPMDLPGGLSGFRYRRGDKPAPFAFSPDELVVLQFVCDQYSDLPLKELLTEVVYATEPMKKAQAEKGRSQKLDMAMVDNVRSTELGLPIAELLDRSRSAMAGHVIAFEVLDAELVAA